MEKSVFLFTVKPPRLNNVLSLMCLAFSYTIGIMWVFKMWLISHEANKNFNSLIYSMHTMGKCDSLQILSEICWSPIGLLISRLRDYLLPLCPLFYHSGPFHWSALCLLSYLCVLTHICLCVFFCFLWCIRYLGAGTLFCLLLYLFLTTRTAYDT